MNEEDIKILKRRINELGLKFALTKPELVAIENLINRNKELEEILKDNWEFRDKCYIPKSKIKEKIEEYTTLLKNCNRFSDVDRIKALNERILAYKELLKE